MSETLLIFSCFIFGLLLGDFGLLPSFLLRHDPTLEALWLLMGLVGFSLGRNPRLGEMLRGLNARLLFLPLATTAGTFLGCAICSIFLARGVFECLAIGAGFAYYSLSSVLIGGELGPEMGATALLANIFREILTLLLGGPLGKLVGPMSVISCGGAASMDTILPAVIRAGGAKWIPAAVFHGMALDFSVPFWVALFCQLAAGAG